MNLMETNKYEEAEVITAELIGKEHGITKAHINQMYNRNKKWFEEGRDVFIIKKSLKPADGYRDLFGSNAQKEAYLFTESGYLNLVKIMDNPRSWEVFKKLKEVFFSSRDKYDELQKAYNTLQSRVLRTDSRLAFLPMKEAIENNPSLTDNALAWATQNYSILICKILTQYTPAVYKKHYKTHGLEWRDHIEKTFPEMLIVVKKMENYIAHLQESELTYKEAKPIIEKYGLNQLNKLRSDMKKIGV